MENKHLVSITDYSKEEIFRILDLAADFEKNPNQNLSIPPNYYWWFFYFKIILYKIGYIKTLL